MNHLAHENQVALENFALEGDAMDVTHQLHPEADPYKIPLEEFLYFAQIQRQVEKDPNYGIKEASTASVDERSFWQKIKGEKTEHVSPQPTVVSPSEKEIGNEVTTAEDETVTSMVNANRALRNATWVSVFYLITTDILGPTGAPYAISQLGYVPGALIFFLLGICAAYTGYILWNCFLKLDSAYYPLKNYGDLVGRIYGKKIRTGVDVLQCVQLLCNVAVIILGNGQGLSQIAAGKNGDKNVCFSVLVVIWALAGMIVGQIKSLQKFGFIANLAIWMNLFVCFATMGVVAHSAPNFVAAAAQTGAVAGPVQTFVVISGAGKQFSNQLQATMNIVYAYGGAMVFIEFMAEMRRPWDFWKGMATAQGVIFSCYMVYGLVVYHYQGQFVINPGNQGISTYGWQTALNVLSLVSALIAAGLYGNVGIKVLYTTFIRKLLRGPSLESKKGRIVWIILVLCYWSVAFVIASAIPQFSALTGLVGAVCILQFTYTFPPMIKLGLDIQMDAMIADGPYDPIQKRTSRIDTWRQKSRWIRAFKVHWLRNSLHVLFFLASLTTAALGIYAAAVNLKAAYGSGASTSFGCKSPVA
jgi:hypothetical protein